jgi:hypothetical protein
MTAKMIWTIRNSRTIALNWSFHGGASSLTISSTRLTMPRRLSLIKKTRASQPPFK